MRFLLCAALAAALAGCAVAPLGGGLTARPLTRGAVQLDAQFTGYAKPAGNFVLVPAGRVLYGLTDRFTVGASTELKTLTLLGRYSLLANEEGLSAALAVLVTYAGGRFSYSGSAIGSWRAGAVEPYLALRYHFVSYDVSQLDTTFFTVPMGVRFNFPSINLGLRYWLDTDIAAGFDGVWLIDTQSTKFAVRCLWSLSLTFTL